MKTTKLHIELLESRLVPSGVTIAGKTATWTDYDGDQVAMKWTGATAPVFLTVTPTQHVTNGLLVSEVIVQNGSDAISVAVKAAASGDGRVDLGYIDASGLVMKSFAAPKASVMELDCGDGTNAIGTLQLGSYGTTNPEVFGTVGGTDGTGTLNGNVGTVKIAGDLEYGELLVGATDSKVGSVTIGGSLKGDAVTAENSGVLDVPGNAGSIAVLGSILGTGNAPDKGAVVTLAGQLLVGGSVKSITVGGDVIGGVKGDSADTEIRSGSISANNVTTLTVKGSVIGGAGPGGQVFAEQAGTVTVLGSVIGGSGDPSGAVGAGDVKAITIGGSVVGGSSTTTSEHFISGAVICLAAGEITVKHNIAAGSVTGGGRAQYDGAILIADNLGSLNVGGDVLGSDNQRVFIIAGGTVAAGANGIGKIAVKGSVSFAVIETGQDVAKFDNATGNLGNAENPDAGIGSVSIGGNFYNSSIMAGINDEPSNGGYPNGVDGNDTASGTAALGPVSIGGAILDDAASGGSSGFEAHTIAKITVAGRTRFTHGQTPPILDPHGYILVREL